jgi:hypothetical protein
MTTKKAEALITSIGCSDSQSGDGMHRLQTMLKPVLRVNFMMFLG